MLTKGQRFCERITDSTVLGSGVVKADGCAVFVKGAVEGDVCSFEITEVKKNFALAELLEITEQSQHRVSSECMNFNSCGGCTLRHISAGYERELKRKTVKSAFHKVGIKDICVKETLMPTAYRYRNNVQLHFDTDGTFGFFEEESSTVCPLTGDGCLIIPETFYEIAGFVSEYFKSFALPYPEKLSLRQARCGNVCVALSFEKIVPELTGLAESLIKKLPNITGIVVKNADESHYRTVLGERYLETILMGLNFRVSPEAFFQVNYEGAELLFAKVIKYAERCKFTHCADLYCGTGVIGMILASRYRDARFTGVEINPEAVEDAKRNAEMNRIGNIDFYCGDAARFAAENKPELVIVDPPRRGLSDRMIKVIKDISPENVIYVSCNPFTLARDVKKLTGFGYKIYEVTPVNMFPRTGHVECVVCLTRGFDNELRERINCAVAYKENEEIKITESCK